LPFSCASEELSASFSDLVRKIMKSLIIDISVKITIIKS
jgi:hypothetical protein